MRLKTKFVIIEKYDCQKEKKSNYNAIFHNKLSEFTYFHIIFHITEIDHSQNRKFKWEISERIKSFCQNFFLVFGLRYRRNENMLEYT